MPSEIRVDTSKNTSGLGTITYTNTGPVISGSLTLDSAAPFFRNSPTILQNYTFTTTYNELSVGPITINSGVTVTVDTGATWTVV